ncbi:MAG: family 20 glycosylhydrolase, partial [Ignavibacteriaceae bacterium]
GHFEKILSYPMYSHLGERNDLLSPAFPESIQFLKDIYSEMAPAFNSPFFNVNADETFNLGKGASKKMVDSLGIAVVYTDQVKKMYNVLKGHDKRMMMWTDILLQHPESFDMLPKDIIMMTWGYDANDSFDDVILPVKNEGFDFTISPGILNSYSTMPDYSITMTNIRNLVRDGVKYGSIGMVLTVWDDGGSAFFSRDWYGVAYGGEQSWNPNQENLSDFNERFNKAIYADETGKFTDAIWKLVELTDVPVTNGLKEKLLWTKVIPDSGENLRIGIDGWDKVKEIVDSAEKFLNEAKPLLYKNDYDYFKFTVEQYRYNANLRFNLIEASNLYSIAQENQNKNRAFTRTQLIDAIDVISNSRKSLINLYDFYRKIWLEENKTNAMYVVLNKYQNQINDLKNTEEKIFSALRDYDSGLEMPAIEKVRLSVKKVEGRFFREWMMINPIPIQENEDRNLIDYLKNMGGELNAVPKVSQEFEYDNKTYRWRRTASEYFDVVNLTEELHDENKISVTYAFAHIDIPEDRIVKASIGSTDGVDVIINGKKIYDNRKKRDLKIDEDTFDLPLKKGRNNLMLKLFQKSGDRKFTFRLPEYEVKNSKNRYKITE